MFSAQAYPFDPSYGYDLEQLKAVGAPDEPADYDDFWLAKYRRAQSVQPLPEIRDSGIVKDGWRSFDIVFRSTDDFRVGGWLLIPENGPVRRSFIVGHGYGGRDAPDWHLPLTESALLFPCCRGISRSPRAPISPDPKWHVLHDIDNPVKYILGGCVEDIWISATVLESLYPWTRGHLGLLGISFSGGIGVMAMAWDSRISLGHVQVPSFGNHPLRMRLPSFGSAASLQAAFQRNPEIVAKTLQYFDAATAARRLAVPMHFACALFDPMVAPPGQFAIHNACPDPKQLFVIKAGHHSYPDQVTEQLLLQGELERFFTHL